MDGGFTLLDTIAGEGGKKARGICGCITLSSRNFGAETTAELCSMWGNGDYCLPLCVGQGNSHW